MAKQIINIGSAANDGTGDPLRTAMNKVNLNFTELYDNQFSGLYADLSGKPTIPSSLLDLGIADGSNNQVLSTDGDGNFTFVDQTGGGGGIGLTARTAVSGTTASIANNANANLDITGFKGYALLTIQTSAAAWVRIYANAASRTSDASRGETTDPAPDAGVIAEVITTGAQTILVSPGVIGYNLESTPTTNIPCAVKNKSGGAAAITVTLNVIQLEA